MLKIKYSTGNLNIKMKQLNELCLDASFSYCYLLLGKKHVDIENNKIITLDDISQIQKIAYSNNQNIVLLPRCYSRSFNLMNTNISQPGTFLVHVISFFTILTIIFFIKRKYTAIGRAELCYLYYLFAVFTILSIVVENGVVPPSSKFYLLFTSIQLSTLNACCMILSFVGLLPFKIWKDGTQESKFFFKLSTFILMMFSFLIFYITLTKIYDRFDILGKTRFEQNYLIIINYVLNSIFILTFIFCELLTAIVILKNYWIVGTLVLGILVFLIGQIMAHLFSTTFCETTNHYLDGMFPMAVANLITYMMLYKCWDISTTDDLEFGVNMDIDSGKKETEAFGL